MPTVSPTSPTQAPPVASALVARVRGFLEACEIDRNLSPLTIRQYDHYLNNLIGWLAREEPDVIRSAPHGRPVGRLDEVRAARQPVVRYRFEAHGEQPPASEPRQLEAQKGA